MYKISFHFLIVLLFLVESFALASAKPETKTFNIKDYGAKGDGETLDTDAINAAIDACTKQQNSKVIIPPGKFVSGSIHLNSNIVIEFQ